MTQGELLGSVALVTGASSGFGRGIASALHAKGCRVFGTTRSESPAPMADGVAMITMDVDQDESVLSGVARVHEEAGRIDVLVNNAGFGYAGALEDMSIDDARHQFETNFFGLHRVCRAVLPRMRERRSGRIVNVGSLAGIIPIPFQGMYSASKFAVEAYTEALRMEVRPFGVHVSLIEPGDFATGFTASRRMAGAGGEGSPYARRCAAAVERMSHDEGASDDLGPVVRTALAAIEARRPRLRYPVGSLLERSTAVLRGVLPSTVYEYLMMRYYGIR